MLDLIVKGTVVLTAAWVFWRILHKIRQKFFAWLMSNLAIQLNVITAEERRKAFGGLKDVISADPKLREKKQIRILEIGCGSGSILEYFPSGSRLVMVDLNPEFEDKLRERLRQFPALQLEQLVHASAEDMRAVASGSVDAVVSVYCLCTVPDVDRTLSEVHRVLAPGGKYFFIEHVIDHQRGSFLAVIQYLMTGFGIWQFITCGCHLWRNIGQLIKDSKQFRTVTYEPYYLNTSKFHFWFTKAQIYGIAQK